MNKLSIYKYLDLSKAHITPETDEFLRKEAHKDFAEVIVYEKEYGYFVCVPPDGFDCYNIPDDLRNCIEFAKENDCNWIIIDRDAEIIDELKTYEW